MTKGNDKGGDDAVTLGFRAAISKERQRAGSVEACKRIADDSGASFLRRRGLSRDRANYVAMLLRHKRDLDVLRSMTMDHETVDMMTMMLGFISDEIGYVYHVNEAMKGR